MVVLVTGAGRGLGLELTRQLLAADHDVIAWVRQPEKCQTLASLADTPRLQIHKVDLANAENISNAAKNVTHVDVVVNCAGVLLDRGIKLDSLSTQAVQDTFTINLFAPIMVTKSLLTQLRNSSSATLVNVSSYMGSLQSNSGNGSYSYRMSKVALNMMTRTFSIDEPRIRAYCFHPGWARTDMGGADAPVTAEESMAGLMKLIFQSSDIPSGSFVNYKGRTVPW